MHRDGRLNMIPNANLLTLTLALSSKDSPIMRLHTNHIDSEHV